jgi:hypothetical protein
MFWCHFLLNEMTRFVQNDTVSCTIKKKDANGVVLMALFAIFFLQTRKGRVRRFFFPSFAVAFFPLSLCLHLPKNLTQLIPPHALPLGVFTVRFGSVFIKKSNQTDFFKKKNRNRTETGSNRPVSVRFGSIF